MYKRQGAIQVNIGNISQGNVVALVNYMSQILVELVKFANLIVLINKAIACGNRVESVFEINSSLIEPEKPAVVGEKLPETVVSFDHVSLKYKNSSQDSLTDINFDVKRGETIGIIGGTGSGKSSLVNMLPRFYDYTGGQLKIDGIDAVSYTHLEPRKRCNDRKLYRRRQLQARRPHLRKINNRCMSWLERHRKTYPLHCRALLIKMLTLRTN